MQIRPYFSRKPYQVVYKDFHTGELKKVTRRPPERLHNMLPTDVVELRYKKNDDWLEGDEHTIKHINPRHPNTIQLQNDEGETTFIGSSNLELIEEVADRDKLQIDDEKASRYLLWP